MLPSRRHARLLSVAGALGALGAAQTAHAQTVTLAPVTFSGGLYQYSYTVVNNTINDLFDVTIHVAPGLNTVQNLIAPTGFKNTYTDFNTGLVDFTEDSAFFTAAPVSGFLFSSPLAPGASTFDANSVDGNFNIITTSGAVSAPQAVAVPESGTLALSLLAVPGLLLIARRRRDTLTQGDHTV